MAEYPMECLAINGNLVTPALQYGAFALCAMMVGFCWRLWVSTRNEREDLSKLIGKKDDKILELAVTTVNTIHENSKALNRLAEALESRPCLGGDRVFQPQT